MRAGRAVRRAAPARPRRPSRRTDPRLLAAAGAGAALALAFPPFDLWPLAVLALAAFSLLTRAVPARRAGRIGFVFGLGFFVTLLRWLHVIGLDAVLALATVQALFLAGVGAAFALVARRRGWWLWQAAIWVAGEALRARFPFGGFSWGRLAFAQADSPAAPLMALGGAPLLSLLVAVAGTALAAGVLAGYRAPTALFGPAAALLAVASAGPLWPGLGPASGTRTVAVVQGNVPRPALEPRAQQEAVFGNHLAATAALAGRIRAGRDPRPDLVIWPENSTDVDPLVRRDLAARLDTAVTELGAPVLVGAVLDAGPRYVRNAGIVWNPGTGAAALYTKRHPVPFGEYLPLRPVLERLISRFARIPRDFEPGRDPGVLDLGGTTVGAVICFEIADDGLVRDVVRGGGRLLVVQTNNATYGRTGQPEQQLAISRLRAIEHGRDMVIAATSGISAILDARGEVHRHSAQFRPAVLLERVALHDGRTFADRVGAWPEGLTCLAAVFAIVTHRGSRRSRTGRARRFTVGR